MSIALFNTLDLYLFSILLLAGIIAHTLARREPLPLSAIYRTALSVGIILIMALDGAARLPLSLPPDTLRTVRYILNFSYLLLQPLPVSLGLMYLFSLFRERPFSPGATILFMLPVLAGAALMAYSLGTGFIFTVDSSGSYHRGPGMFLFAVINYSFILPSTALVIHYRDRIKRCTLISVIAFTLLPCAGSLAQLLSYGTVTAWPSFALAVAITNLFLEGRRSDRDYLTGLLNRQSFDALVHRRIAAFDSRGGFTLVVADLDRFKDINDRFGHDFGDEVLQEAASILSHSISDSDAVACYGGDEFVIILETVDGEVSSRVLARIEGNFERRNRNAPVGLSLSVSAGAAVYDPARHGEFSDLFKEADGKMFEAKRERKESGRTPGRFVFPT